MADLPNSYKTMYPSRFLDAEMLAGQKVTLTVKAIIGEELVGDNEKAELKWILQFVERDKQLVIPKVNGECFRRMFGNDPHLAIGKRVTFFPTKTKCFGKTVDCIRIWGSPDLAEDMQITVRDGGSRKGKEMTMHKVNPGECGFKGGTATKAPASAPAQAQATPTGLDPRILTAFGILGWNAVDQAKYVADNQALGQAGMVKDLNRLIEEQDNAAA